MQRKGFGKKAQLFLSLMVIALMLAACGGNNGAGTTTSDSGSGTTSNQSTASGNDSKSGDKVKIAYWTIDRHDMDFMQAKVDEFNANNTENIEVEMKVMADNYNQAVEVAFASNQAPDIFRGQDFQTYVSKGYYAELDNLLSEELLSKFEGLLIEGAFTKDGHVYILPNSGQFWRLIYNQDLLEKACYTEPPTTLDEMVDIAKKVTEQGKAEGIYGFASNFKNGSGFTRPAYASGSLGSENSHEGYNFVTGEFDFGMYKDIAEAMRQMKVDGSMLPGVETLDIDPLRAQFAQGKIAMYVNHSSEPAVYDTQFPTDIRWSSALVPTKDGVKNGVTWVNASGYIGISAQSSPEKQAAAATFLEYLYSLDVRTEYQELGLGLSVLPYVNEAASEPQLKGIEGFLPTKYDGIFAVTPLSVTESKLEGKNASTMFTEYILAGGGQDIDSIIADLNSRYAKALEIARAEGLTTISADPNFSSKNLQGSLGE